MSVLSDGAVLPEPNDQQRSVFFQLGQKRWILECHNFGEALALSLIR